MIPPVPVRIPLGPGEIVVLASPGYLYTEKPSVWASAQGKAAMETMTYLTNRRIITEPKKLGALGKAGLFLALGPAATGAAASQMFQTEDAIAVSLRSIFSAESLDFHRQRMIKLLFGTGTQTLELLIGLERKEDVPAWCNQILQLKSSAAPPPRPSQQSYPVGHTPAPGVLPQSAPMVFCFACGNRIPATAKFCPKCGTRQMIPE